MGRSEAETTPVDKTSQIVAADVRRRISRQRSPILRLLTSAATGEEAHRCSFCWACGLLAGMLCIMADGDTSVELLPADLASGDGKSFALDCEQFDIARIRSSDHALFRAAYDRLWAEFGPPGEMESRAVIARRLGWHPAAKLGEFWLRYEMVLVMQQGRFAAVRD